MPLTDTLKREAEPLKRCHRNGIANAIFLNEMITEYNFSAQQFEERLLLLAKVCTILINFKGYGACYHEW